MVKIAYYVAASADGLIAPADGSLDWLSPFQDTGEDHGYVEFYGGIDALIVGSRTYEQMLGFGEWPHHDRPVTVMSARALPIASDVITVSEEAPGDVVRSLSAAGHERIWLVGGGALAGSFDSASLIDDYIISYLPVFLGAGVGLFGGRGGSQMLELVGTRSFSDGIVQCHYRTERGVSAGAGRE